MSKSFMFPDTPPQPGSNNISSYQDPTTVKSPQLTRNQEILLNGFNSGPATKKAKPGPGRTGNNQKKAVNPHIHNTANNVATTLNPDYQIAFSPNILDNYDVYTYHWKLFITSLENASSGHVLDPAVQTIIAESGVSDLTIDKIEIQSITTPSTESGTGTQTLLKFEIIEPSGAALLDQLFYQATALGIGNWLVMPCFIQLEFRGRDPVTGASLPGGTDTNLGALRWVWPIKLTNSKANVTQVGTHYEFDAIFYNELAQSNSYFTIQHNVVLSNIRTLGDALKDLEDKLNADQWEKLVDDYSIPDIYRIHVDPVIANKVLAPPTNKNTKRASDFFDLNKKTGSYNAGTSIDSIINSLCAATSYFQEKLQDSTTPSSKPKSITEEIDQMKKFWRVITETKPTKFDIRRQDNAVEIDIYVTEYDLGAVDVVPEQTGQTQDSIPASMKRFTEYIQKKILRKKYNYIFTGLNDQVINLDLNMNFSFAAALSRFGGEYIDSATSDQGIVATDDSKVRTKISEQVKQTLSLINSSTDNQEITTRVKTTTAAIKASKLDQATQDRYISLLGYARAPNRMAVASSIVNHGGISNNGSIATSQMMAKSLAAPVSATNSNGDNINLTFISDVNPNSPAAQQATATFETSRKGKLRPIVFKEDMQDRSLAYGVDPENNPGRARTSSIFSTALYSTLDASLQRIKMTIKGDPFWLFPRRIGNNTQTLPYLSNLPTEAEAFDEIKNSHKKYIDSTNIYGTDNFIIIRFRTPKIYNTTTTPVDPFDEVNTFSGVYKVIMITSKFEGGKFIQELDCNLDPVIDLRDFLKDIENAMKTPDSTLLPGQSPISSSYIKTDKLNATANLPNGKSVTIRDAAGNPLDPMLVAFGTNKVDTATSNIPTTGFLTTSQLINQITAAKKP